MEIDKEMLETVDQINKGLQAYREGKGIPAKQFFDDLLAELELLDGKLSNPPET